MRLCTAIGLGLAVTTLLSAVAAGPELHAQAREASAAWSPIENDRVKVYAVYPSTQPAPPLDRPIVQVYLDGKTGYIVPPQRGSGGVVALGMPPKPVGGYMVWIELKDRKGPPLKNATKYPLAFPRPRSKKILENDRVVVWDYTWNSGEPTPVHFHDKDVVVIYLEDGELRSTEPSGQSVVNPHYFGFTKFNSGNRVHTEELIKGKGRAIITELK